MNSKFSIRMIPREINNLVFSNDDCVAYKVLYLPRYLLRAGGAATSSKPLFRG